MKPLKFTMNCSKFKARQVHYSNMVMVFSFFQIEKILMNDTVTANNDTWAYMSNLVDGIVRSLLDLENTDVTGVEDWFKPVMKALENMGNTAEPVR